MDKLVKKITNFPFRIKHLISGRGVQLQTAIEKEKKKTFSLAVVDTGKALTLHT